MEIIYLLLAILVLILLISWVKLNAFVAFLIASLLAGALLGIPLHQLSASVREGIGSTIGDLAIIIVLGAMLGKLVAMTGAAQRISSSLIRLLGKANVQWALMITGFIAGIPLFYNVGFILLVPLLFSVTYQAKLPLVYTGIPMLAALSVTHGFLPPHPSPTALVAQFHADLGLTLVYGICIAVPVLLIAGPLFSRTLKKIKAEPLETFQPRLLPENQLPGVFNSYLSSLLPVLLLILTTAMPVVFGKEISANEAFSFFSDPGTIMLVSLLVATWTLGIKQHIPLKEIMHHYSEAAKDVVLILLVVAGAGALKQVLSDSHISDTIGRSLNTMPVHPLVLGWLIACIIRVCVGSATVAGLTAAGIVAPLVVQSGVRPELMVLAVGAGSLMFSHVNDAGFWMYKEYFNLSVKDTLRSWTLMETIVGVAGLAGVLVLDFILKLN